MNFLVCTGVTDTNWNSDPTASTSALDNNDKLYLIDAPNIAGASGVDSVELRSLL